MGRTMNKQVITCDQDAEKSVLGAIILDNNILLEVLDIIDTQDFYKIAHKNIFDAIKRLHSSRTPVDLTTLDNELREDKDLLALGGIVYLASLFDYVPSTAHAKHHAEIMKGQAINRQLLSMSIEIKNAIAAGNIKPQNILEGIQKMVFQISLDRLPSNYKPISQIVPLVRRELFSEGKERIGIKTYFPDIDKQVGLLVNASIITIVGFTGCGKTALVDSIILRFVKNTGRPVFKWSGEMSEEECTLRYLCMLGLLDSRRILAKTLNVSEKHRYRNAEEELENLPIILDTTGGISFEELKTKLRKVKIEYPDLGFVVIDNLPLMSKEGESESQKYRNTMKDLRAFSKDLGCPIFVLTQYSFSIRKKDNRMPENDDILFGSSVIQDSTNVWHVFDLKDSPEIKKLKLGKGRYSPTGMLALGWNPTCTLFSDCVSDQR